MHLNWYSIILSESMTRSSTAMAWIRCYFLIDMEIRSVVFVVTTILFPSPGVISWKAEIIKYHTPFSCITNGWLWVYYFYPACKSVNLSRCETLAQLEGIPIVRSQSQKNWHDSRHLHHFSPFSWHRYLKRLYGMSSKKATPVRKAGMKQDESRSNLLSKIKFLEDELTK